MTMKVTGDADLIANFEEVRKRVIERATDAVVEGGKLVQRTAKDYSPLDRGNLENSIRREEQITRDGANIVIGVDDNEPVPEEPGKRVGDYATQMHEGDYNLGPGSRAKANELGVEVGRKYVERALEDNADEILRLVEDEVRKALFGG